MFEVILIEKENNTVSYGFKIPTYSFSKGVRKNNILRDIVL